jgi:hypothetical protein
MKVKILSTINAGKFGLLTHLQKGQITNLDEEFAHELVEKNLAEYEIESLKIKGAK